MVWHISEFVKFYFIIKSEFTLWILERNKKVVLVLYEIELMIRHIDLFKIICVTLPEI